MQMEISGIKIEVQKKNIKNLHLVVAPPEGKVRVSAPMHLSDESIAMFVRTKLGWIKKQQEKFKKQPRQTEREYVSGETLYKGISIWIPLRFWSLLILLAQFRLHLRKKKSIFWDLKTSPPETYCLTATWHSYILTLRDLTKQTASKNLQVPF